jgi:predicted transcriptional regulator
MYTNHIKDFMNNINIIKNKLLTIYSVTKQGIDKFSTKTEEIHIHT